MNEFSFLVGFGASLGLWQVSRNRLIRNPWFWLSAGLAVLLGALFGARLGYVLVRGGYYLQHPLEMLQFSAGGLSGAGAVLGGLGVVFTLARTRQVPAGALADGLFPLLPALAVCSWLGCWMAGAAYGFPAPNGALGSLPVVDESGVTLNRVAVQVLAAVVLAGAFFLLEFGDLTFRSGQRSAFGLICLGLVHFGVSFLRADPAPLWNGLRLDAWAALALALAGLIWLLAIFLRRAQPQAVSSS